MVVPYGSSPPSWKSRTLPGIREPSCQCAPGRPGRPYGPLDHVVSRVADLQLGDEALWRALMRAILDRWSAQQDVWFAQQDVPEAERIPIRGDTRLTLTREALSGLADQLPPDLHERLTMAMVLIFGAEAMITARDVTALSPAEAKTTMRWAARALIQAALAEAASDSAHRGTAPP